MLGWQDELNLRGLEKFHNRARPLLSKTHQANQGEVRIQWKRSAIYWTCDDEEAKERQIQGKLTQ